MYRLIFQLLIIYLHIFEIICEYPEVEIPQGKLQGATRTNIDGGHYSSFQNIPYAKPPLGELRFKAPQPADSWNSTRDATNDLPSCIQYGNAFGQEDCLYLNVYTPGLPDENIINLPVMVWIYGGTFRTGTASESIYGGQFLLTKDIVLVVLNYRVGIFGFISLDDATLGVPGNAGMKDQILALEWVRDNIQYFGGDPNNVSIFGESAGAISVQYLILSPLAQGLFHRAISQSGDTLTDFLTPYTRNTGAAIAEILGIQTENWEDMLISLQAASSDDLALAESSINLGFQELFSTPIVEVPSEYTFLGSNPLDIIRSGDYNQVPFIIGVNDAEGLLFQMWSRETFGENLLIEDFTLFVPREFNIQGTPLEQLLAIVIKQFYYGDSEPSSDNITQAVALTTDYSFAFSAYRSTREYLETAENPIYFYYFTAVAGLNYLRRQDPSLAEFSGAGHSDDLGYLFYMSDTPDIISGSVEDRLLRNMVNLWTNFAIYGNPTPDSSNNLVWEPVTTEQFNYIHIGTEEIQLIPGPVYTEERINFWWSLYEQYT